MNHMIKLVFSTIRNIFYYIFLIALLFIAVFFILKYFIDYEFHSHFPFFIGFHLNKLDGERTANLFVGLSALFTFFAFWVQYTANKRQDKIHATQSLSYSKEKTEQFFFNLINIARENTQLVKLNKNIEGKKSFHYMFYEFTCIYGILSTKINCEEKKDLNFSQLFTLSYTVFINGVFYLEHDQCPIEEQNKVTNNVCKDIGVSPSICSSLLKFLYDLQNNHGTHEEREYFLFNQYGSEDIKFFDGHRMWLSFCGKHLMQVILYIYGNDCLNENKRYNLNLLGCQMSDHELFILTLHCTYWAYLSESSKQVQQIDIHNFKEGLEVLLENMERAVRNKLCDIGIMNDDHKLLW